MHVSSTADANVNVNRIPRSLCPLSEQHLFFYLTWAEELCSDVKKIHEVLDKAVTLIDPKFSGEVLGSYRRGEPWCSDVDLVMRHEDYEKVSRRSRPSSFQGQ